MRKKVALLLILFVGFITFIGVKFFVIDRKTANGVLKIESSPSATVFIDEKNAGKTPFETNIVEGEHLVKLIPGSSSTNTAQWQGKVVINAKTQTFVNRELGADDTTSSGIILSIKKSDMSGRDTGEILVETEPSGAIVYLDNDEKDVASLLLQEVKKGEHEISVYSPGFIRRTQKINVEPGFRLTAQFKLAIDPTYQKVEDLPEATASADLENKEATGSGKKTLTGTPTVTTKVTPSLSSKTLIIIKETSTGWLRVREEPSVSASESAKVNPGERYELLEEQSGWQKIEYIKGKFGWVSGQYTEKQ